MTSRQKNMKADLKKRQEEQREALQFLTQQAQELGLGYQSTEDNPFNKQVGGSHYKDMKIQPIEFIMVNQIPFIEGNIIKYLCRWKNKNGLEDLKKAKHYLDILIEKNK